MKRTPLSARALPNYSRGEESMNFVTHTAGGGLALLALVLTLCKAIPLGAAAIAAAAIYGLSMVAVYTISSVYHGLPKGTAKKVLQVIDHCTIYLLIAGSYTPIMLLAMAPAYPAIGYGMLAFQWAACGLAITLTAIDLKKYRTFSMTCYVGMGWGIALFFPQTWAVLGPAGFYWLLSGGIAYTIGAVLFALGSRNKWMHPVFHLFVILGSLLQWVCIYFYVL